MASAEIKYDGRMTRVRTTAVYAADTGAEEVVQHRVDVAVVSGDVPDTPGALSKVNHRVLYNRLPSPPATGADRRARPGRAEEEGRVHAEGRVGHQEAACRSGRPGVDRPSCLAATDTIRG